MFLSILFFACLFVHNTFEFGFEEVFPDYGVYDENGRWDGKTRLFYAFRDVWEGKYVGAKCESENPLHKLARSNLFGTGMEARYLIKKLGEGANEPQYPRSISSPAYDQFRQSGLTSRAIFAAASADYVPMMEVLVKYDADIHYNMGGFMTALHAAAFNGKISAAKALISWGVPVESESYAVSPLIAAILSNREDMVKLLLHMGGDVNKPMFGVSPLHVYLYMIFKGNCPLLNEVLNVYEVWKTESIIYRDRELSDDWTGEKLRVFRLLLDGGANVNFADAIGNTAIDIVSRREDFIFKEKEIRNRILMDLIQAGAIVGNAQLGDVLEILLNKRNTLDFIRMREEGIKSTSHPMARKIDESVKLLVAIKDANADRLISLSQWQKVTEGLTSSVYSSVYGRINHNISERERNSFECQIYDMMISLVYGMNFDANPKSGESFQRYFGRLLNSENYDYIYKLAGGSSAPEVEQFLEFGGEGVEKRKNTFLSIWIGGFFYHLEKMGDTFAKNEAWHKWFHLFEKYEYSLMYGIAAKNYEFRTGVCVPLKYRSILEEKLFEFYLENKDILRGTYLDTVPLDLSRWWLIHVFNNMTNKINGRALAMEVLAHPNINFPAKNVSYDSPRKVLEPYIGDLLRQMQPG